MMRFLVLVDRNAGEDGGKAAVETGSEQERVHDIRPHLSQVPLQAKQVPGVTEPGIEAEHAKGRAGPADFLANRSCLVDAGDRRLEPVGKVPDQVEHLFGSADHERVCKIQDPCAAARHDATCA